MIARTQRLLDQARARVEVSERMLPMRGWLLTLSRREIRMVERVWRGTRHDHVRRLACIISWLGNGLLYLLCAAVLLWFATASVRPVAVAALSIGIAQLLYPWIKLACGRPRPFVLDRALAPLLPPLDRHSFPSGHGMTLTAALVPLLTAWPGAWGLGLVMWLAMAWSRIACAHHYPSDVVAGTVLGAAVAIPFSMLLL